MTDSVLNYAFDGNNISGDLSLNNIGSGEARLTPEHFGRAAERASMPGTTTTASTGRALERAPMPGPNTRAISNIVVAGDGTVEGPPFAGMMYAWGQFVDHDLGATKNDGVNHIDIAIPSDDPALQGGSSIPLTRAVVDDGGRVVNQVTGWLDASMVYGPDEKTAAELRLADGSMATSDGNNLPIVRGMFAAGDNRAAENPSLTAIHTLMVREHNTQAERLRGEHPDWSGDQIYNRARAIVTAEIQNITYNEFLPALLGSKAPGPYHGYDQNVDPRITEEFSGSAFRFGHSIVSEETEAVDNQGVPDEATARSLAKSFFIPPATFEGMGADGLLRHLMGDISQRYDVHIVDSLRNLLVDPPAAQDLAAINLERGRDLGFGSLNDTRQALGLKPYASFDELASDPKTAADLAQAYGGDVNAVELWIGGLAEKPVDGALVGETFQTIIARQFDALRQGDPLWFENQGFDDATLKEIRATTLSDVITRNTDTAVAQPNAFLFSDRHASNVEPEHPDSPQLVIGVDDDGATVAGGDQDDTIVAGRGRDQTLIGGAGSDTFVFLGSGHVVTVSDFMPGTDKIDFANGTPGVSFKDLAVGADDSGSAVVRLDGYEVHLPGVSHEQIPAASFLINHHSVDTGFALT
jgi:peroxidase